MSLHRYNAILSDVRTEFKESEITQIITGLDSSVTAITILLNSQHGQLVLEFILDETGHFSFMRNTLRISIKNFENDLLIFLP